MDIPQVTSREDAATGEMGQEYLATGKQVALRRWEEGVNQDAEERCRDYEPALFTKDEIGSAF